MDRKIYFPELHAPLDCPNWPIHRRAACHGGLAQLQRGLRQDAHGVVSQFRHPLAGNSKGLRRTVLPDVEILSARLGRIVQKPPQPALADRAFYAWRSWRIHVATVNEEVARDIRKRDTTGAFIPPHSSTSKNSPPRRTVFVCISCVSCYVTRDSCSQQPPQRPAGKECDRGHSRRGKTDAGENEKKRFFKRNVEDERGKRAGPRAGERQWNPDKNHKSDRSVFCEI